jgi:hypothetical protein
MRCSRAAAHPLGVTAVAWGAAGVLGGEISALSGVESLRRGLRATAGVSLAVFCLLVGIGSWLIASPPPTWFPWRGPWIVALLLLAAVLLLRETTIARSSAAALARHQSQRSSSGPPMPAPRSRLIFHAD